MIQPDADTFSNFNFQAEHRFVHFLQIRIRLGSESNQKYIIRPYSNRERVRVAQRQNDTVVKSTRCVTLEGGGSLWHSDKTTRCVNLAQRQNDSVRHFGTVCHYGTEGHFGTATKCLIFDFFII